MNKQFSIAQRVGLMFRHDQDLPQDMDAWIKVQLTRHHLLWVLLILMQISLNGLMNCSLICPNEPIYGAGTET